MLKTETALAQALPSKTRVAALDITKGALVICMVIYHSLNHSSDYTLGFKYLAFLPPSFILITGFLISGMYLARTDRRPDGRLYARLFVRGLKLLLLFTALNVVGHSLRGRSASGQGPAHDVGVLYFFQHAWEVYIEGEGRLAGFEVLVPIAYLLMAAPVLIRIDLWHRMALPIVTVVSLAALTWWERHGGGSSNAHFLSAGLVGLCLGRLSFARLQGLRRWWPLAAAGYAGYLWIASIQGQTYLIQILGAVIVLALFYGLALLMGSEGWVQARVERLGQYSLLAYIGQIAVLQVLDRLIRRPEPLSPQFLALFLIALVATVLIVESTSWARRWRVVNVPYRAVFG